MQRISQKSIVKTFVDYFPPRTNGMTKSVGTQKLFHTVVVHSKPRIEKIGICH